jgi:integrase
MRDLAIDFDPAELARERVVGPIPFDRFRRELLSLYEPPLRALATKRMMVQTLDMIGGMGVESTDQLTLQLVAKFVTTRPDGRGANTTLKLLRCIRSLCNYAVATGSLRVSPFAIRPLKSWLRAEPPIGKRHCSREEIRRLLDLLKADVATHAAAREHWRAYKARRLLALVATVAYAGLRRDEALYLHAEDVDLQARSITIRSRERKAKTTGSEALLPVPAALAEILAEWAVHRLDPPTFPAPAAELVPWQFPQVRGRGPWRDGAAGAKPLDVLQDVARRAGLSGVSFHALRRSWATHAESSWGLSGPLIQRVLRHTTEKTSELWYRSADLPNLRQACDAIDF